MPPSSPQQNHNTLIVFLGYVKESIALIHSPAVFPLPVAVVRAGPLNPLFLLVTNGPTLYVKMKTFQRSREGVKVRYTLYYIIP